MKTIQSIPTVPPQQVNSLLDFCRHLVRIPSLSGEEGVVARAVSTQMRALGFDQVETDELGNVIGIIEGSQPGSNRLLDAHMDVVPVTNANQWQHAPFGAEISKDRLWGRGAADTKGSLAAMICAAAFLPRKQLTGRAVVLASVCEENMTGAALQRVLRRYPADVVITGEPTNLKLGVAQKGRLTIIITVSGRSVHTSRPELGENAAYKMIEIVQRLRALPPTQDAQLGQSVLELTELVSDPLPGTTFVPHGCRARFIGRIMPGETAEGLLAKFRQAVADIPGVQIELDEMRQVCYTGAEINMPDFIPGWRNAPNEAWQSALFANLAAAGLPAEPFYAPCGTNASVSAGLLGLPSFILGPGSLAEAHIVDEWVSIPELIDSLRAFQVVLQTLPPA